MTALLMPQNNNENVANKKLLRNISTIEKIVNATICAIHNLTREFHSGRMRFPFEIA